MDQPTTPTADLDDFLGVQPKSRRSMLIKWGLIVAGLALVAFVLFKVFGQAEAPGGYALENVQRGNLRVSISATGNLQPTNQVEVGSEISGLVTDVFVDFNDRVSKGQVLARIDTSRLQDTVTQTQASLQAAQAQVAIAQATAQEAGANLRRLEEVYRLSGGKVPSAAELDTGRATAARAQAQIRAALAQVAQVRAQLSSAQIQVSRASLVSPVNGVVLSRQVEPGQTVAASLNAPVLFLIAEDLSQMELQVKVDEADVGQVADGQRATFTVDAFPGRTFPARIQRVDVGANGGLSSASTATTSASTGQVVAYTAVLSVDNPDQLLRPGMTATADIITTEKRGVLLVPNAALRFSPDAGAGGGGGGPGGGGRSGASGGITDQLSLRGAFGRGGRPERTVNIGRGSQQTVYVLGADGQPTAVRVTVGDTNGSETEVTGSALKEDAQVITGQLAAGQPNEVRARGGGARR